MIVYQVAENEKETKKMTFTERADKRFTVRKFTDKQVEKEKLEAVLQAGNKAPTAKNQQPQKIYVLQSESALDKLAQLTQCGYGAKTVLVFAYDTEKQWHNPLEEGVHSGVEDVSIVATYMMLQAAELGLSTCWVNFFANSKLEQVFDLPETEKAVLIMPIGYAPEGTKPFATHEEKKDLAEIVKYL